MHLGKLLAPRGFHKFFADACTQDDTEEDTFPSIPFLPCETSPEIFREHCYLLHRNSEWDDSSPSIRLALVSQHSLASLGFSACTLDQMKVIGYILPIRTPARCYILPLVIIVRLFVCIAVAVILKRCLDLKYQSIQARLPDCTRVPL